MALFQSVCLLLVFLTCGCAQLEKGYQDTKKVIFPEEAKAKPSPKASESKKPPEAEKPKEPAPPAQEATPAPAKTAPVEDFILHKVAGGETLATIARWYSGKTTTWREIAAGNPGLDPSRLKEGQVIKIPLSIATMHKEPPAPSSAGSPAPAKKTVKDKEDSESPGPPEAKPVFGPK